MGLLAYVNGVLTSFGGTTAEVAVRDVGTQETLTAILIELRVQTVLLRMLVPSDDNIDDLREDIAEDMT